MKAAGLSGLSVAVTGTLAVERKEIVRILGQVDARFDSRVGRGTNILITGDKPGGTKLREARRWSVQLMSEAEFWRRMPEELRPRGMVVREAGPWGPPVPFRPMEAWSTTSRPVSFAPPPKTQAPKKPAPRKIVEEEEDLTPVVRRPSWD